MGNKLVTALLATYSILAAQVSFAGNISQTYREDWNFNFSATTPNFAIQLNDPEMGNVSLEAEFSANEIDSTSSVMVNALYDMGEDGFSPYIGFGAGVATSDNDGQYGLSERISELHSLPAYQAIAGISYTSESYPTAIMHMGYKYFATIGKTTANPIQEPGKNNLNTQNVEAGVRLSF